MEHACEADNEARLKGVAATNKLKLLPKVTAMLNRTAAQDSVLDPDTNFLRSVKFFLEPLNDGSLPAYNIQRDLFTALAALPINKEVLLSSGIGKVVFFYTRSKRPEASIKRIAERLVGEWSRPILKRTDDYRKRQIETRDFDFAYVPPNTNMAPSVCTDEELTAPPNWLNAKKPPHQAPKSPSPSARPAASPAWSWSVSACSRPKSRRTTARRRLACPPVTPSHRGARLMPRGPRPSSVPWAPRAWKRSGR